MKWLSFVLAAALVSTVGCSGEKKTAEGEGGKKLTVDPPASVTVKAGETAKLTIAVKKEKFDDDVKLTFDLPDGVTIEEKDTKVEKNGKEATFTVKADAKAKVQDGYKAKVTAEGGGLKAGPAEFTINVKDK